MPKKLFISYPSESWNFAQRIAEGITRQLAETVFIDYKNINDADFERAILTNLRASDALLLIVTDHTFEDIHKDADWIRLEIRTAIEANIPIVLVRENGMLTPKDLPDDVKQVGRAQGVPFYKEYFDPALTMLNEFLVTIGVGTARDSARANASSNAPQIISQSPPPPPTAPEPQRAIQGRGSFEEATRLLNGGDTEKALFILRELKDNYHGVLMGAIDEMIAVAEQELIAAERLRLAALIYDDIAVMMQGRVTKGAGKTAFVEWAKAYPDLVTLLDTEKLKERIVDPPAPTPAAPLPKVDPLAAALNTARNFAGKRNRDWTPFTAVFKGSPISDMKFCLVPVGSFQMGSTNHGDERPIHPQKLDQPYWIAQTPVTNAQWQIAVKAGVVKAPVGNSALSWYQEGQMANAPVVGVDWRAATTFAEWLGARLLTELEWEYAARGVESWVYPWGDTWVPDNAVFVDNSGGGPNAVTTRPQGASWVGALHLSGNVWEWTSSLYDGYPYVLDNKHEDNTNRTSNRVLRGGSWYFDEGSSRAAYRGYDAPGNRHHDIGFRVGLAVVSY